MGETVRRAFAEFLTVPILIIFGFMMLAAGASALDRADVAWLHPLRAALRKYLFLNAGSTGSLLATIAGSLITVISIIFSMLLLAVQQAASALTHQVYDQFLRRHVNQAYFGFFVGLAVYTLIILATVDSAYNPVLGAALALALTLIALILMILLLYTTINQMRPAVVIEAIHRLTLVARDCQLEWLGKVRSAPQSGAAARATVPAAKHGFVVAVNIDALAAAATAAGPDAEIVLKVSIGTFVAHGDALAEIRAHSPEGLPQIAGAVPKAVRIEEQRDLDTDAAFGVEQLAIIGWTSISTAKSNPAPGLLTLHSLRDLLARWSARRVEEAPGMAAHTRAPVVYVDDVFAQLMGAFETLTVVASESMQPQTIAEIVRTFAGMFERLPAEQQDRAEEMIRRGLSALGEHVLTSELDEALSGLVRRLDAAGRTATAEQVRTAQEALRASIGKLGSRATRARARD